MNILLVQPRAVFQTRGITYPVCRDLMTAATFLKQRGYTVTVWDRCADPAEPAGLLRLPRPDAALFLIAQSASVKDAITVSDRLRKEGTTVIWADMIAMIGADLPDTLNYCDYLLTGEISFTADALLEALFSGGDVGGVEGIAFRRNGVTVTTPKRALPDLSLLPATDWSLIDVEKCFRRFPGCSRMLYLNASVGCPFSCGFCSTPFCYGKRRKRPIALVTQEIDDLVRNHRLDGVNFSDELLLFTEEELLQLKACRERNGNAFIWGGETRPQLMTRDLLRKMYDAGCRWLLFGLESGDEGMRAWLSKPYDAAYVRNVIGWCSEIGISTFGSFIIGFPGETERELYETVNYAVSLDLDAVLCNFFVMIGHTPLYEKVLEEHTFRFHSILEFNDVVNTDRLGHNFSQIPNEDLLTVKAYFDLFTATRRKAGSNAGGLQFLEKAAESAVLALHGAKGERLGNITAILRRGTSVFYYPVTHPAILKKYGLRLHMRHGKEQPEHR